MMIFLILLAVIGGIVVASVVFGFIVWMVLEYFINHDSQLP